MHLFGFRSAAKRSKKDAAMKDTAETTTTTAATVLSASATSSSAATTPSPSAPTPRSPSASSASMTPGSRNRSSAGPSRPRTADSASVRLPPGAPSTYRYNFDYITKGASALVDDDRAHAKSKARPPLSRHSSSIGLAQSARTRGALSAPPPTVRAQSDTNVRSRLLSSDENIVPGGGRPNLRSRGAVGKARPASMYSTYSTASSISSSSSSRLSYAPSSSSATSVGEAKLDKLCDPALPFSTLETSALYQSMYECERSNPSALRERDRAALTEAARQRAARGRIVAGMLLARSTSTARPLTRRSVPVRRVPPGLGVDIDREGRAEAGAVRPWGVKGKGYVKSRLSTVVVV